MPDPAADSSATPSPSRTRRAGRRLRRFVLWSVVVTGGLGLLLFAAAQVFFARGIVPVEPFAPTEAEREVLALYGKPTAWFAAHLQGPREVVDGQVLDPKLQYLAEQNRTAAVWAMRLAPVIFFTPWGRASIRNRVDRDWTMLSQLSAPMARVSDRRVAGRAGPVPVRIYWPRVAPGLPEAAGPLPLLVYHHGGGWIFASVAASDRVAKLIANEARAIVVSVDYRLAPEHPYPAASDDGEDVFLWARANATALGSAPGLVGAGGDSAGGHVAINIAQRQRAAGRPGPAALLLYYPGAGLPQGDRSYRLFGSGYLLDAAFIEFILPRVFPGYGPERVQDAGALMDPAGRADLRGLPPAVVATAGFDILRDSGRRFAYRLAASGVPVRYTNYGSLTHSFLQFSGIVADAERATVEPARAFGHDVRAYGVVR